MDAEQLQRVALYAPHVKAGADTEANLSAATGIAADIVTADLAGAEFCAVLLAAVDAAAHSDGAELRHGDTAEPGDPAGTVAVARPTPLAARAEPGELAAQARRVTVGLLDVVEAAVQAGDLDVDDAAKLLPRVHAVHTDIARIELARNTDKPKLPVFNITFELNGAVTAERSAVVIDAEPARPGGLDVAGVLPSSAAEAASPAQGDPLDFLAAVSAGLEQQRKEDE